MGFILRNIELILTAAGLLVISCAAAFSAANDHDIWKTAAITATAVGVIHGVLFWVVRHRQRVLRNQAIAEVQSVLSDIINNQLAIISTSSELQRLGAVDADRARSAVVKAVEKISRTLKALSEETLSRWHERYGAALPLKKHED